MRRLPRPMRAARTDVPFAAARCCRRAQTWPRASRLRGSFVACVGDLARALQGGPERVGPLVRVPWARAWPWRPAALCSRAPPACRNRMYCAMRVGASQHTCGCACGRRSPWPPLAQVPTRRVPPSRACDGLCVCQGHARLRPAACTARSTKKAWPRPICVSRPCTRVARRDLGARVCALCARRMRESSGRLVARGPQWRRRGGRKRP